MKRLTSIVALFVTSLPAQQYYHARSLGVLPGYDAAQAMAINNKGYVAGYSFRTGSAAEGAFLYSPESCQMIDLGSLGGRSARATGINDDNLVVGSSVNIEGRTRAFGYLNGTMYDLGGPWPSKEMALSVNKFGNAAGSEVTPGGNDPGSAVVYTPGAVKYLPSFEGARVVQATGINEFDQVVGHQVRSSEIVGLIHFPTLPFPPNHGWFRIRPVSADPRIFGLDMGVTPAAINRYGYVTGSVGVATRHAFLSRNFFEPTIDLGTLNPADPGVSSVGFGIDSAGRVVGFSEKVPFGGSIAVLHDGSTMIDLNTRLADSTGWELMSANAISDNGQIVGTGRFNGQQVAFVLLPTSTPHIPPKPCIVGKK